MSAGAQGAGAKAGIMLHVDLAVDPAKEKEMLPLIIDYVKSNPKWQVSLQIHKYMNIP